AYYDAGIANTRRGLDTGLIQARSVVESALAQAERDLTPGEAGDVLLRPFDALPANIPAEAQQRLRARAQAVVSGPIAARRLAWRDLLRDDYLARAPQEPGLVHRPGGRDLYAFLV